MSDLISRQAAFIALNKRAENVSLKTRIGLLDAVRVIDELPSVEPEKCGDCISREAVLKIIADKCKVIRTYPEAYGAVKRLPTVEPERKTGKWIDGKCDRCGTHAPFWEMATTYYCSEYCPKCGSKMEVTDE